MEPQRRNPKPSSKAKTKNAPPRERRKATAMQNSIQKLSIELKIQGYETKEAERVARIYDTLPFLISANKKLFAAALRYIAEHKVPLDEKDFKREDKRITTEFHNYNVFTHNRDLFPPQEVLNNLSQARVDAINIKMKAGLWRYIAMIIDYRVKRSGLIAQQNANEPSNLASPSSIDADIDYDQEVEE